MVYRNVASFANGSKVRALESSMSVVAFRNVAVFRSKTEDGKAGAT